MSQAVQEKLLLRGGFAIPGIASATGLATQADGTVVAGSGGGFARTSAATQVSGLTTGAETAARLTLPGKGCLIYAVRVDQPGRVRLYATQAQQQADIARAAVTTAQNTGCLLDYVALAAGLFPLAPASACIEQDTVPSASFFANVRCDNGATINVTLYGYAWEA